MELSNLILNVNNCVLFPCRSLPFDNQSTSARIQFKSFDHEKQGYLFQMDMTGGKEFEIALLN